MIFSNHRGFTLVEMLAVVVIIGILATASTVMYSNTRPKVNDVKRINDVKQIQTALHLYYGNQGRYPDEVTPGGQIADPDTGIVYLAKVPSMPASFENPNCNGVTDYTYTPINSNQDFELNYCLDRNVDWVPEGKNIVDQNTLSKPAICGLPIEYAGKSYSTANVNGQCLLTIGMNTGNQIAASSVPSNDSAIEKWCPLGEAELCDQFGALYSWAEAMDLPASCNTSNSGACSITLPRQGICPPGWHVASDAEMHALEAAYATEACDGNRNNSFQCQPAEEALLSYVSYGSEYPQDSPSGFDFEPIAIRTTSGSYSPGGMFSGVWTASNYQATNTWAYLFYSPYFGYDGVNRYSINKLNGLAVRCFQD